MATTTKLVELFNAFADASLVDSTATAFVEAAYENLLGLSGDFSNKDARVAYWVEMIEGGLSRADFAATFLAAAAVQGDLLTDAEFAANEAALEALEALDETDLTLDAVKEAAVAANADSETYTLTTGIETVTQGATDDTVNGVTSVSADERTLNVADVIDGGEGQDTLVVDVNASFAGFANGGGLQNVETVELNNETSISRSFNATGTDGVETYNIDGDVSLSEVNGVETQINLANLASGTFAVDYQVYQTEETNTANYGFTNVGTSAAAQVTVDVTEDAGEEIENMVLAATGDNFIDLVTSEQSTTSLTVSGAGNLTLTNNFAKAGGAAATTVDASDLSGDFNLITQSDDLTSTVLLTGGAGSNDTLTFAANAGAALENGATTLYRMTGIEHIVFDGADDGAGFTFSASNASGIESVTVTTNFDNTVATVDNLGNINLTVNSIGESAAGDLSVSNTGETVINIKPETGTLTAVETVDLTIRTDEAAAVEINIDAGVDVNGATISADTATSVDLTAAGDVTELIIDADEAVDASLVLTNVNTDTTAEIDFNAASLESLTISTEEDLDLENESDFGSLEVVTIATNGSVLISELDDALNTLTVSGSGQLNDGLTTNLDGGANLTATFSGLTEDTDNSVDALTLGTVDVLAGGDITFSATDITGNVTVDDIGHGAKADNVTLTYAGVTGTVAFGTVEADESINIVAALTSATVDDTFDIGNVATVDAGSTVTIDISSVQLNNTANASGSELTVGTVTADASINFNAAGVTADDLVIGDLTASDVVFTAAGANLNGNDVEVTVDADTATITGTDSEINTITVTADDSATIVGGAKADVIILTGDADANAVATFTLDLVGSAANQISYDADTGSGAVRLTIENFVVGGDKLIPDAAEVDNAFTIATDVVEVDATANGGQDIADARETIVSFLADAGVTATALQISNVFALDSEEDGTGEDFLFTFDGNVHLITQDGIGSLAGTPTADAGSSLTFDDNDAFITLVGVGLVQDVQTAQSIFATAVV